MTHFSRSALSEAGFTGWVTFDNVRTTNPCPDVGGVYVVARAIYSEPCFLDQSCGGWFKARDPTVPIKTLIANWVPSAEVIYIGKANSIRRRLREFAKFGNGHKIGHWGGRLIWQLQVSNTLLVAWMPTPAVEPHLFEADLIEQFRSQYGKPPFANNPHQLGR